MSMEGKNESKHIDFLREHAKCGIYHNYTDPEEKLKTMNEAVNHLTSLTSEISELLAIMHGDGGHHRAKVGTIQAIKDAKELLFTKWQGPDQIDSLQTELSEMKKENERLKKENKVIYGSEMVQLSDYQDLKKEREELKRTPREDEKRRLLMQLQAYGEANDLLKHEASELIDCVKEFITTIKEHLPYASGGYYKSLIEKSESILKKYEPN